MKADRLQQLIEQFPTRRIAVIGDFFLDKYLDTDPALVEPSVETGKPAHQVVGIHRSPGAAGTVVNNLAALQAGTLHAIGAIGLDGEAFDLRKALEQIGCRTDGLLGFDDLMTPTYLKPRDITVPGLAGEHSRYDTMNRTPTPDPIAEAIIHALMERITDVDAVIVLDQVEEEGCGVITSQVRTVLSELSANRKDLIFWGDSRSRARLFRNMIVKANQFEAVGHANPLPDEEISLERLKQALPELRRELRAPVVVTRSAQGMLVSDPEITVIPTVRVDGPIDSTGAGDSATAGAVLALASGATLAEAALVGCLVASITVEQLGTTGVASPNQLPGRLELWRSQNPDA